jgi:hypothetical protein
MTEFLDRLRDCGLDLRALSYIDSDSYYLALELPA